MYEDFVPSLTYTVVTCDQQWPLPLFLHTLTAAECSIAWISALLLPIHSADLDPCIMVVYSDEVMIFCVRQLNGSLVDPCIVVVYSDEDMTFRVCQLNRSLVSTIGPLYCGCPQ